MEFKEKLKILREHEKITQKELGDSLGIGQYTVSLYETGKSFPSIDVLIKISDYFDCSLDGLLKNKKCSQSGDRYLKKYSSQNKKNFYDLYESIQRMKD